MGRGISLAVEKKNGVLSQPLFFLFNPKFQDVQARDEAHQELVQIENERRTFYIPGKRFRYIRLDKCIFEKWIACCIYLHFGM